MRGDKARAVEGRKNKERTGKDRRREDGGQEATEKLKRFMEKAEED